MYLPLKIIGYYIPYFLNILTIVLLFKYTSYFLTFFYIVGIVFNSILNFVIKVFVKQPRPKQDRALLSNKNINTLRFGFDKWGFPSGHAQSCAYSTIMTFFVFNKNIHLFMLYLLLSSFTCYQRIENYNHTLFQVIGGLLIGSLFGFFWYKIYKQYV
jgi:membrane-associated phospholipid phosphatase